MSRTLPTIGQMRDLLKGAIARTGIQDPLEAARVAHVRLAAVSADGKEAIDADPDDLQALRDGFEGKQYDAGRRDLWRLGRELAGLDRQ